MNSNHEQDAAPAQPAAPQGVAYADAHGAIIGAAYDFRDAHISGSPNEKRSAHAALESAVTHALRASNGQAPASRITIEQVEDAIGLQSTAWDAIGAEKIVEAVLRLANWQAPAGATNTKTHALLSTMIGLFLRAKEKIGYQPGSAIDKTVAEAVEHLKDWPYPETATAQAAPAAGAVAGMPPGISALMCVISSLRDTAHFSDEEGELTDELRTLRDWAMTQAAAPTPAAQPSGALTGGDERRHIICLCPDCVAPKADSGVQEDAAREAVRKVLDMFPFNATKQGFSINGGPSLSADGDTEFYSVKKVLEFMTAIKTTLDAARRQGGA